ncbi:MAG: hypothetical protein Q9225_001571 [Loekoesia sp. 1 TL-2023]
MKSLDSLVRHLLEEIALCGDYGAGISDFITYVNGYYAQAEDSNQDPQSSNIRGTAVDRKFLETVWRWLSQHRDIEVGEDGWANKLSLSEVERQSASAANRQNEVLEHAPSTPERCQELPAAPSSAKKGNKNTGHQFSNLHDATLSSHRDTSIRIYASIERRWQAIAGHAPDPIKIPRLDFACLSIVAAQREEGILQPDLVRISQQDKRSVPERTRRLHDAGYISKVPVLINKSHTSKLTLKRYVKETAQRDHSAGTADDVVGSILRPAKNSTETPIDFLALQHEVFDILRDVKLITFNELKDKLGITGLPWPMRLLATNLRRLEHMGCIKQVRAHPATETTAPFLFRCVKYIRDPEGKEWEPMQFSSRKHSKELNIGDGDPDVLSDEDREYEAEEARYLAGHGGSKHLRGLKEIERPVPQWSGDGTLSNLLYDLIHASGLNGISTMVPYRDLKNRSMGCFNVRPTENHLSRLVEMWQMSQPLHLRHLAIIRDAALTDGIPHYIHYSFVNFEQLVDQGKASWESVMTITKEHEDFKATAAIEAEPELDETGFSKLSKNLFHGRHNDAGLVECIKGVGISPLSLSTADPKVIKLSDGSWGLRSRSLARPVESQGVSKASPSKIYSKETPQIRTKRQRKVKDEPNLVVTKAGRERKIPKEGLPAGFDSLSRREKRYILWCQEAARKYKKSKLTKEIEKRIHEGGDRCEVTANVLNLAIVQYRNAGQEPPWESMEEIRLAALVPSLVALEALKGLPTLNTATWKNEDLLEVLDFKPSAVAHSRALQKSELEVVEDRLKPGIYHLESIPINDNVKKTNTDIMSEAQQRHDKAEADSSQGDQGQRSSERARKSTKKGSPAGSNDPDSNIAVAPSQPGSRKRKYNRKKNSTAPLAAMVRPAQLENPNEQSGNLPTRPEGVADQYLPSVAAHTWPVASVRAASEKALSSKRKPELVKSTQNKRQKRASWKKAQLDQDVDIQELPSVPRPNRRLQSQTYEQQLEHIHRPSTGCHIGQIANLHHPGKPGPKRKSQLAVFKSARIQGLACFRLQTEMTEPAAQVRAQDQTMENGRDHLDECSREAIATEVSSTTIMPTECSMAPLAQPSIPLSVRRLGNQDPLQLQHDGLLDQGDLYSAQQSDPLPMPINPSDYITQPSQYAYLEHSARLKRKRKINDDASREGSSASPVPLVVDKVTAMSPCSTSTANGVDASFLQDQTPTHLLNIHLPLPQQELYLSTMAGDLSAQQEELFIANEASRNLPVSSHQLVSLASNGGLSSINSADAEPNVQGPMIIASSDQSALEPSSRLNQNTILEQQKSANFTPQTSVDTPLLTGSVKDSHNDRLDPVTLNDNRLEDAIFRNGFSPKGPGDDTAKVSSNQNLEALDITASGLTPELDNNGEVNKHAPNHWSQEADTAPAEGRVPRIALDASAAPKGKRGVKKMRPQGGSIAAQRRKIVMDIVERCGGIYPGIPELGAPFKEQWTSSGHVGRAETATLKTVVKTLCESGQLRQLKFCFKDYRGLVVTRSMLTKVEVSPTDSRVSEMQKVIIKTHPAWYIPDEAGVSDEVRNTYWNPKGPMKNRTMKDLEVEGEKVQLQQKPSYLERYEIKERSRQERKAQEERQAAVMRALIAQGKFPDGKDIPDRGILGSLKTAYARNRLLSLAKRTVLGDPQGKVGRLASIRRRRAGTVADDGKQKPLPTGQKSFHERSQAIIRDEASKRLEELRKIRSPLTKKQLTFTRMLTAEDFETDLKSQMLEEKLHELAIERIAAANAAEGIAYGLDRPSKHSSGVWPPLVDDQRPYQKSGLSEASQTMTFRLSKNGLSFVPDSDPVLLELATARRRKSLDPESHSWAARQQMYTIMEPEHAFHPATGTFFVNFSRFRTTRQIMQKYHWQRPPVKSFDDYVDDSQRFELSTKNFEDAKFENWPFVNYVFPHSQTVSADRDKDKKASLYFNAEDRRGHEKAPDQVPKQTQAQSEGSPTSFQTARESQSSSTSTVPSPGPSPQVAVIPAKRKRSIRAEPYKTRRLTTLDKLSQSLKAGLGGDASKESGVDGRLRRNITRRRAPRLTADAIRRLLTAVIVIRTLTGGVERNIDWVLITKVFEPEWDQVDIQRTWPKVLQSHKVQAEMIQADFHPLFLKAYEKGLVPSLDYDNLRDYDWPWLIDWTIEHLDTPIDTVLDLPSQRNRLEELFDISAGGDDPGMSAFYEFEVGTCSVGRRETELHKRAWVQPLTVKSLKTSGMVTDNLAIAKTWIRANIATKEEAYRPEFARDKIDKRFDPGIVDQAIKELLGERVIMQLNKGRLQPRRNYDLNQHYVKRLNKKIEVSQFYRAPILKREIDKALANHEEMIVPPMADDAFMLAIQNMQAHQRLSLIAKDPPMEKFGLGGVGNYKSRQIPHEKYHFDVGMRATETYVVGNPLLPLPEPPLSSQVETEKEKIPLWYDINSDVIEDLWMTAVAAVMAILVMRPGVSVHEIEPSVRPTLGVWEVQMLLDWMVDAKAARKMGQRYMAEEWWWLCLDSGRTFEDSQTEREKESENRGGCGEDLAEEQREAEGDVLMEGV